MVWLCGTRHQGSVKFVTNFNYNCRNSHIQINSDSHGSIARGVTKPLAVGRAATAIKL